MSSATSKQDMSMEDILASIRSYVAEGQNLPKSDAAPFLSTEEKPEKNSYDADVIQLTDEVIPVETINLQATSSSFTSLTPVEKTLTQQNSIYANPQPASSPFQSSPSFDNPFSRLQNEIKASVPASTAISSDELLNQLATPLIKNWLDQNLRKIVESIVEKEIERMRRG
jgi:cell pole-organizing protein PopZ